LAGSKTCLLPRLQRHLWHPPNPQQKSTKTLHAKAVAAVMAPVAMNPAAMVALKAVEMVAADGVHALKVVKKVAKMAVAAVVVVAEEAVVATVLHKVNANALTLKANPC